MKAQRSPDKLAIIVNQKIKEREYWKKQLEGETVSACFPFEPKEISAGEKEDNKYLTDKTKFTSNLFKRLIEVSGQNDYTLHVLLTAGVTALLYKYTGCPDIIVGTPIYRQSAEGEYINTVLPLRFYISEGLSFKDLLIQARQKIIGATEHQNFPIQFLANRLKNSQFNPEDNFRLLNTAVLLRNIQEEKDIIVASPLLTFSCFRTDHTLEVEVRYRKALNFLPPIRQILEHLKELLIKALQHLETELQEIDILSVEEKKLLVEIFNNTAKKYPIDKTIHGMFTEQAYSNPHRIATVSNNPESYITYGELNERSDQAACHLKEKGVGIDCIVALMVERSFEMIIGILGILKAGGAYLPIDPGYPEVRKRYILIDSCAAILLSDRGEPDIETPLTHSINFASLFQAKGKNPKRKRDKKTIRQVYSSTAKTVSSLAYVIYTSGSTGNPKGVMIRHYSLINRLNWMQRQYGLDETDIILQKTTYTFDVSVWELLLWGMKGARLCLLVPGGEIDSQVIIETCQRHQITLMHFVPSMLKVFLDFVKIMGGVKKIKSLRQVIASGEALSLSQVKLFNSLLFKENSTRLANLYGPTEASIDVSFFDCSDEKKYHSIPIGKPIDNIQLYILDKQMALQPMQIAGELCISGDGLARGYLNRPLLTAEKFVSLKNLLVSPGRKFNEKVNSIAENRIYKTGDLARWLPDGNVDFLGRIDHQVKIRGFRVEMGEIEEQLLKHKDVNQAIVIARENKTGDKYLCTYIVVQQEVPIQELRDFLSQSLPDYMVPTYFIFLRQIPVTANGKVNRKELPEPETIMKSAYRAPRDEIENKLTQIWSEELGIEKNKVGIDTSFFELGGHSLRATRVIAKIYKELSVTITMAEMFATPYIRKLALRIKHMSTEKYAAIEPGEKKEFYPLSSAQKRLYILQQMNPMGVGYNIPTFSILEGELLKNKLEDAFKKLIKRHESLRTFFQVVEGEPVQLVRDEVKFNIDSYDLENTQGQGTKNKGIIPEVIIIEFVRPFDLMKAPLLHAGLMKISNKKHVLAIDMHHIISDGVSEQILFQDFTDFYMGKELPRIRLQYRDFAQWQNNRKKSKELLKQEQYWLNEFKGDIPVLNLPSDYPRPAVQSFAGRTIRFEVDKENRDALRKFSLETGTTMFMLLLALYSVLLSKLANQEDIIIGTPIAGRRHTDLEKIIGIFINTLVLRNLPIKEKKFSLFLQEVKEKSLKAFENQDYQYEDLVEHVAVSRDVSRNPLFDTMFILQNIEAWKLETTGLSLTNFEYQNKTSKFDLTLTGIEVEDKILFSFEYCSKIFTETTIKRFIGFFLKLISEVVIKRIGDVEIAGIDIISTEERRKILFDFNNTEAEDPSKKAIHTLFERQVQQIPDHVALVGEGHSQINENERSTHACHLSTEFMTVTYNHLNEISQRLADVLAERGIQTDTVVAIMTVRSVEMIAGLLGVLKAGGAYLPLDPVYPQERLDYMLADSRAKILLADRKGMWDKQLSIPTVNLVYALNMRTQNRPRTADHDPLLAYVIFTSGSTGKPKGVMIQHKNVVNFILGIADKIAFLPGKAMLTITTISFDIFVLETYLPLIKGMKILLASERQQIDPDALVELMMKQNVQMAQFTPSRLKLMLSAGKDLSALRYTTELMLGGEALPTDLLKEIKQQFQGTIFNMYGPTETTVWSTFKDLTTVENIDIGKPIANTQIYILNSSLALQPIGITGDLYIGGDGVARGYLNRVELTADRFISLKKTQIGFVESPFSKPTQRFSSPYIYKTGDLARWQSDGNIDFLGRIDYQVKIRGFRIELEEIEIEILKCPDIKEVVVVDRENSEGKQFLCAFIVSEKKIGISQLKSILQKTLPEYMIPSYFIQIEKIPLTYNGKIDRKALDIFNTDMQIREEYAAPRSELEHKIAQIWKEVLKLEKIGVNENFFDLGGTSMDIIRLSGKFKEIFNEQDTVMQMFRYPTIISFARYLNRKREGFDSASDIQRTVTVGKIKKSRQNQRNKRLKGGTLHE